MWSRTWGGVVWLPPGKAISRVPGIWRGTPYAASSAGDRREGKSHVLGCSASAVTLCARPVLVAHGGVRSLHDGDDAGYSG